MNLSNYSVRGKILLLSSILAFLLLITCTTGLYAINDLTKEIQALHKNELQQARLVNAARAYTRGIEVNMLELLLANNTTAEQASARQELDTYTKTLQEILEKMDSIELAPNEKAMLQQAKVGLTDAAQARLEALRLLDSGNRDAAWQTYKMKAQENITKSNLLFKGLAETADKAAAESEQRAANLSKISFTLLIVISILAFIFGGIATFFIARAITKPLSLLADQAHKIASGDLSSKALVVAGKDEISRLTASFNDMQAHLHDLIASSQDTAQQTAASSEELTATSEQCAIASTQINTSVVKVAEASTRQQGHVETTSAAIQEISASIQQIAATAENFSHVSDTTASSAKEGEATVRQAVEQIQTVAEETASVHSLMGDLTDSSRKISEIITLITSIADQTNLLALNAAIEAARAGEQGRGFAVVAEEVRKLAEDSAKAAHHIGDLVQANEVQVNQVAASTNNAVQALRSGQETVEQAGQQFISIAETVDNLAKEMREISQSVEEAAKGAQSIVGSASLIDDETRHIAAEIQQISAAMQEQTASLEEVSSAGQSLATLADNLLNKVNRFQL